MSVFYVNAAYDLFRAYDGSPVIFVDCSEVASLATVDTADALSDPSDETLRDILIALSPKGAAWRTPDGQAFVDPDGSAMGRAMKALAASFGDLYRRAFAMTQESRIQKVDASLPEWEAEWGLPDPCVTETQTLEQRLKRLQAKVTSDGTITVEDFVRLAAFLGYTVAIELPDGFECGVSDCGGIDELSNAALDQQWTVYVFDIGVTQFEVGLDEVGVDRLLDFQGVETLECVFRALAPAWTFPVFNYGGWPLPYLISSGDGFVLGSEGGYAVVAPALPTS